MKHSFLKRLERVEQRVVFKLPADTHSTTELGRRVAFLLALGAEDALIEPPTERVKLAQRLAGILAGRPVRGVAGAVANHDFETLNRS